MRTAPQIIRDYVYKQRDCKHMILMPAGFGKWNFVNCIEVFFICPNCDKDLTHPERGK